MMTLRPVVGRGDLRSLRERADPAQPMAWKNGEILFDQRRWACAEAEVNWIADHHLLILTEAGETKRTQVRFDGRTVYEGRDRAGALTFVPAGVQREGFYRDANLIYSALWIGTEIYDALEKPSMSLLENGFVNGSDDIIAPLIGAVGRDLAAGEVPDSAFVEHMVALILLRLAGRGRTAVQSPGRGGNLSSRLLRRVDEFIEANLCRDISLRELAGVAGLPVDAFSRRFKATTGQPPYAYVIERRIARAETMLADPSIPLGKIAVALGFSSQSHFTSTFCRLRGVTPRNRRRQFLPES
jgi:AraC family transcriptional regulator